MSVLGYSGSTVELDPASARFAGETTFAGSFVLVDCERARLESLLPVGLALAERADAAALDTHPVLVFFGEQTRGRWLLGGMGWPLGLRYLEAGLAIPCVRVGGGAALHTWIPRMYADYYPAVWAANAHYGFSKHGAVLRSQGREYGVDTDAGRAALRAELEPCVGSVDRAALAARLAPVREILRLPVLGQRAGREWVASYFRWTLASARPALARCSLALDTALGDRRWPLAHRSAEPDTVTVRAMLWSVTPPFPARL